MPGPARSDLTITCAYCHREFTTRRNGKHTNQYCSHLCGTRGSHPARLVTKHCLWCGEAFEFRSSGQRNNDRRRFCGTSCAAKWRYSQPDLHEQYVRSARKGLAIAANARRGTKNPAASARMKAKWPQSDPEVYERWRVSLCGRTFLARGGNPHVTEPQLLLAKRLRLPTEFVIRTAPVAEQFECLPHSYKVDLADPARRLAIEVDGKTHRQKKWRFLDARKTAVLSALGWSVLRFTNEQVLQETDAVIATISSFTTSK